MRDCANNVPSTALICFWRSGVPINESLLCSLNVSGFIQVIIYMLKTRNTELGHLFSHLKCAGTSRGVRSRSSFPADNVPVHFSLSRPTLASHRGLHFAWLVRWEPEDALDWGERTRSRTVRTFHHSNVTISEPFDIDGNHHSSKRAFG